MYIVVAAFFFFLFYLRANTISKWITTLFFARSKKFMFSSKNVKYLQQYQQTNKQIKKKTILHVQNNFLNINYKNNSYVVLRVDERFGNSTYHVYTHIHSYIIKIYWNCNYLWKWHSCVHSFSFLITIK